MKATSQLTTEIKFTIKHDGESNCITKQELIDGIKRGIAAAFRRYNDDEDFIVYCDIYMVDYEYTDSAQQLRENLKSTIDSIELEDLDKILRIINNKK